MASKRVKNFSAKSDFTEEMLPNNRRTQLLMIIKNQAPLLFKTALVTLVFFIPLIIALSFKTVVTHHFYSLYQGEALEYELYWQYLTYTELLASLAYVPCLVLASIGVAGLCRVTHQLIFGEGILFREDYLLGIKNNALQYMLYTFVVSMIYVLARLAEFRFSDGILASIMLLLLIVAVIPYYAVLLVYSNVYSSRGGELIRNVFYAMAKGKGASAIYSLVLILPPLAVALLSSGYLFLFLTLACVLLLPVAFLLGNALFADVFDEAFNYLNNVDVVKRGLYVSPEEREIIEQTHKRLIKELEK